MCWAGHGGGCVNQAAGSAEGVREDKKDFCPRQKQDFALRRSTLKRDREKTTAWWRGRGEISSLGFSASMTFALRHGQKSRDGCTQVFSRNNLVKGTRGAKALR